MVSLNAWTDVETALLAQRLREGRSDKEIAEEFGRPVSAIAARRMMAFWSWVNPANDKPTT